MRQSDKIVRRKVKTFFTNNCFLCAWLQNYYLTPVASHTSAPKFIWAK